MRVIKFALIGCGNITSRHIEAIQSCEGAELMAVCDADEERAKAKGLQGVVPYYLNYHTMLQQHPEIQVVTLLTPSGLHYVQAKEIIQRYGKHLLLEKPFVLTTEHAFDLKAAADLEGVRLFPLYQNRFNKAVQRVKQAASVEGELGRLRVGTVRVRWCRPQRYYDLSAWRGTWAMDGGAFTNQGVHFIDLLRYLCGEVKRVHAKMVTLGAKIEVEDTGVAILEFKSGGVGVIEIMTSARPDDFEASISYVGEKGMAVVSGKNTNQLQIFSPDNEQTQLCTEEFVNGYGYGHNVIIQNVVDVLLEEAEVLIPFDDGVRTIQLLHALYKSDELDRWVDVDTAGDSLRLGREKKSTVKAHS